jgi:hypothetical protein
VIGHRDDLDNVRIEFGDLVMNFLDIGGSFTKVVITDNPLGGSVPRNDTPFQSVVSARSSPSRRSYWHSPADRGVGGSASAPHQFTPAADSRID